MLHPLKLILTTALLAYSTLSFSQTTEVPLYKQLGIRFCSLVRNPEPPKTQAALQAEAARCETELTPNIAALLNSSRSCFHSLMALIKRRGSPDLVPQIAREALSCSSRVQNEMFPIRIPPRTQDRAVWDFLEDFRVYVDTIGDEFQIVQAFNEAVERNDVRIIYSMVSSLATQDAKRLIPSGLTTGMLMAGRARLIEEQPTRLNANEERFRKAKVELIENALVIF